MKVYLDMCAIQRPLDTPNQVRITVEAEAVLGILALSQAGELDLVSSDALLFELRHNPNPVRKQYAFDVISQARTFVALNEAIERRATAFIAAGIKPLDAFHLASAEEARADYFCTCDDRLLEKAKSRKDLKIRVVAPTALIQEVKE
ncbi:MAG: PIN domain-containing protein [Planctomycetota bacterium]